MAAGVAQEELQRVRGRLRGDRLRRRSRLRLGVRLLLGDLDAALLEPAIDGVGLEGVEAQHLQHLCEVCVAQRTRLLGRLDQLVQLGGRQDVVDLDCRHPDVLASFHQRA